MKKNVNRALQARMTASIQNLKKDRVDVNGLECEDTAIVSFHHCQAINKTQEERKALLVNLILFDRTYSKNGLLAHIALDHELEWNADRRNGEDLRDFGQAVDIGEIEQILDGYDLQNKVSVKTAVSEKNKMPVSPPTHNTRT